MTKSKHTPTPWHLHKTHDHAAHISNCACVHMTRPENIIGCEIDPANAAFIVRAVNNHDALVSSLSDLIQALDEDGRFDKNPDPTSISGRARAALNAARGDV